VPVSGPEGPTTGSFRASDLLRVAGLTYRQLNDWEKRGGVLSSERATEDGWRRFTGEEVLALSVCARLRRQLSLPLPQIGQLYLWLVGRKPDKVCSLLAEVAEFTLSSMERNEKIVRLLARRGEALTEALKEPANAHIVREYVGAKLNVLARTPVLLAVRLASLGFPVYLCTTVDSSMILLEGNLVRWVAMRAACDPTITFPLNEIIKACVQSAGREAFGLDTAMPSFMERWSKLQEHADVSISEREALRLIRERAYQRVTLRVQGGQIVQIDTQEDIAVGSEEVREKSIIELIKSKAYQTVEIVVQDGRTVALRRKIITKVPSGRGKNPNR